MLVFDKLDNKYKDIRECIRYLDNCVNNIFSFEYTCFKNADKLKEIHYFNKGLGRFQRIYMLKSLDLEIVFSKRQGFYFITKGVPYEILKKEIRTKGKGEFPYSFHRDYEAINLFDLFNDGQELIDTNLNPDYDKIKYSMGFEFETSCGYIPEDICKRDGLIPLRDGSITGLEYSSVILKGSEGIQLLKQQLNTLNEYTRFDKNCALHIHFGNFPLEPDKIFNLYVLCMKIQNQLVDILPEFTFKTRLFKETGKDYCKSLPVFNSFNELYRYLVGNHFFGSLRQPHPNDLQRIAKWKIPTR